MAVDIPKKDTAYTGTHHSTLILSTLETSERTQGNNRKKDCRGQLSKSDVS
ncbi:MAG: hypothetical protein IKT83_07735 [Bacteroidaceae bacterium]|nr:hypothetical protein [Bacteroidaceae bacterium]